MAPQLGYLLPTRERIMSGEPETRLIARIRDEAHRFAITYHRKVRSRASLGSPLTEVPGVGPKRRKALLERFGGLDAVRKASIEELTEVPGITRAIAERIRASTRPSDS